MTEHLTLEDLKVSAKRVLAGREDYIYQAPDEADGKCVYFTPVINYDCNCGGFCAYGCAEDHDQDCTLGRALALKYDEAACIVGHMLVDLGLAEQVPTHVNASGVVDLAEALEPVVTFDRQALRFMMFAQSEQDSGAPWGSAVEKATAYADLDDPSS